MSSHRAKFLRVSLTSGLCRGEEISSQTRRGFVGGRGFGIKYLFDEISPGVDPFGPDNRLLFLCGVLAGTSGQGFSRWLVMTKSPLTEGVRRAAATIGKGAERYAMHVKGLEMSAYEPRAVKGQGLSFAVSNIGASHNYARARQELSREIDPYAEEGKGKVIALNTIRNAANETGIVCSFCTRGLEADALGQLVSSVTGLEGVTEPGYMDRVGERIVTLERCFNVREGYRRNKDDVLPLRFLTEPLRDAGPASGQLIRQLDALIDEYYGAMGYSSDGIPTPERLQSLGLVPP